MPQEGIVTERKLRGTPKDMKRPISPSKPVIHPKRSRYATFTAVGYFFNNIVCSVCNLIKN